MTSENRENMHRAIGVLEGLSWVADDKVSEALTCACEILWAIIQSEGKADES